MSESSGSPEWFLIILTIILAVVGSDIANSYSHVKNVMELVCFS